MDCCNCLICDIVSILSKIKYASHCATFSCKLSFASMIIYVIKVLVRVYSGYCHPAWLQLKLLTFVENLDAKFRCGLPSKFELLVYCNPTSKLRQHLLAFIALLDLLVLDSHEFRLSEVTQLAVFSHLSQIHEYFRV